MRKRVVNTILKSNLGKNEVHIFLKGRRNSIFLYLNEVREIKYDYQFYELDKDLNPFDLLEIIRCENGKVKEVIYLDPEEISYIHIKLKEEEE